MECVFLYNAYNKNKRIIKKLDYIVKRLTEEFGSAEAIGLSSVDEVKDFYATKASNYKYVIHSGGDGTFNLMCNFINLCDKKPIMGYLPSGTACDNARKYKLKKNVKYCLDVYAKKQTVDIDVMKVNDFYSSYVMSKGKFVKVSYNTSTELKKKLGMLAYIISGIKAFFARERFVAKIKMDDKVLEEKYLLVLISNSNSISGRKLRKDFEKDVINVYTFTGGLLSLALFFLFGEKAIKLLRRTKKYQCKSLEMEILKARDNEWSNDGEGMVASKIDVSIEKNIFKLLV